ncbi:probable indole-3-pyruvate monooxygenase YUCCA10 [Magnolia sinica]|uniref:probable indole-3-pyruvate monooxygenase YUCCA10 n=1 Tax=Magnolia sinica TaxID=86752 RepID=UPI0026580D7A|nr:probable indole-3-pyruvate monooxygenase YUCCA10 [Magnolia sinica]
MESIVVIVGAGSSGLATSACLNHLSIPNIILEREDCCASLWKKRAYDRLNLHLAKQFCHLPHMPHPPSSPTYIPKKDFIQYIDQYVSHFKLAPLYHRSVESVLYDQDVGRWVVVAHNLVRNEVEEYRGRFLIVATGENSQGFIPDIPGLETFSGNVVHSNQYKSGSDYLGKAVLVVGSGNSGMEIAFDLSNFGAETSIVVRSPVHVLTRDMVHLGMVLLKYLPCSLVDTLTLLLSKLKFGDLSQYGISRPAKGPFFLKAIAGRSPVIDVGTIGKIMSGEIQVLPPLASIRDCIADFADGTSHSFDAIVFATGYRSTAKCWLKGDDYLLDKEGMPLPSFPNHWKGENGLYCAGLSRRGLAGVSMDAENIANDIKRVLDEDVN